MVDCGFKEVSHTADLAVEVWAPDQNSLLTTAAQALYHLLEVKSQTGGREDRKFGFQASDDESLLVSFLNELLFYYQQENIIFSHFKISRQKDRMEVNAVGNKSAGTAKEIKAATYHRLDIQQTERGLEAIIVFDV